MKFFLTITETAKNTLIKLKNSPYQQKPFKAVTKALKFLLDNPRHPGLQTHEFTSLKGPKGEKVFEAYAQQDTPCAYRIFFYYGAIKGEIVIIAITKHP